MEQSIDALLDGLRRRELVFRHEVSAFAGTSEYLFKHMLLREVTYERVLKRQRRIYHAQAAAWLIAESRERADEYAAQIAEHYTGPARRRKRLSGTSGRGGRRRRPTRTARRSRTMSGRWRHCRKRDAARCCWCWGRCWS
jgi:hypothetical protein